MTGWLRRSQQMFEGAAKRGRVRALGVDQPLDPGIVEDAGPSRPARDAQLCGVLSCTFASAFATRALSIASKGCRISPAARRARRSISVAETFQPYAGASQEASSAVRKVVAALAAAALFSRFAAMGSTPFASSTLSASAFSWGER